MHARRHHHQGVPAGDLRRRRCARHRTREGASRAMDVQVRGFGAPRDEAAPPRTACPPSSPRRTPALETHGHRPADRGGCRRRRRRAQAHLVRELRRVTAQRLHGIPHIVTAHSLEPLRPWKAEQLGGGYRLSSCIEKTAYEGAAAVVAVSDGMRADILRSYPALDPARVGSSTTASTSTLAPERRPDAARAARRRPRPAVRGVRRADHAAEGAAVLPARGAAAAARGAARALRGRPRHRRRSWPR